MVTGMAATVKITLTLQRKQTQEIRALIAAGRTSSVSGFVQHAVTVALHDAAGWREMLEDALKQTGGPLSKKERAWADQFITAKNGKKIPKKRSAA